MNVAYLFPIDCHLIRQTSSFKGHNYFSVNYFVRDFSNMFSYIYCNIYNYNSTCIENAELDDAVIRSNKFYDIPNCITVAT